ncbi:MAG: antibiotic biosynthesis monooxygenase [Candidatus Sumerlaeia bacterium]|nr:antibiotic biosynthesis monooxygenase [Candidatus Sumerlaeia bacterium]
MFVVCVTVWVKPGHEKDFIEATLENARQTRCEPGNVRFDVLQCVEPANQFFLYEVYRTPDDFKAHQQTDHYLRWKAAVADWMAQPRQGIKHQSLFPPDEQW